MSDQGVWTRTAGGGGRSALGCLALGTLYLRFAFLIVGAKTVYSLASWPIEEDVPDV